MTTHVQAYIDHLTLGSKQARLYDLEHPVYETEEEFRDIMQAWIEGRTQWNPGPGGPICPKPKRRPGRPQAPGAADQREAMPKPKPKKDERLKLTLRVTPEMIGVLAGVKGEQTIEECILEILTAQLGPLLTKPVT